MSYSKDYGLVYIKGINGGADYKFPVNYILLDTYKPIRSVQDLDSYRDANGILHRNALSHKLHKVEFQCKPMTNKEFDGIMGSISARYVIPAERKVMAYCYIAETGTYAMGENYEGIPMYIPDIEVTIRSIEEKPGSESIVRYDPITLKFIGY